VQSQTALTPHAALEAADPTLFTLLSPSGTPIGLLLPSVVDALIKVPTSIKGDLEIHRPTRTISIFHQATEEERSAAVAKTANFWREKHTFKILEGWRDELYPVYGEGNELLWNVERAASALFGVVTYGVHMTGFVRGEGADGVKGMKIWVPRRATTKTYGGMLDNTVAGGSKFLTSTI
jgi:hypothetical protein